MTPRDYEILDLVYRYRHLEARHIRALIPGSKQQITRRLQGLFHNRYLRRYLRRERMRVELNPGTPLTAYGLDSRGARALNSFSARAPGIEVAWKPAYARRTEWFLEHRLAVSHVRCVLELAVRHTPTIELLEWLDGDAVSLTVKSSTRPGSARRLVPDARIALSDAGERREFFLELDRSTEEHRRLEEKYVGYWSHFSESTRVEGSPLRANVLFVTTSEARMGNMIDSLRQLPRPNGLARVGRGLFLFTVLENFDLLDPNACLKQVWRKASRGAGIQQLV